MTIKEIVSKKAELIALKKAEIKTVKGCITTVKNCDVLKINTNNADTDKSINRTIVGNTYLWMDSHDDVHAKGVFTKSIKERKNNIFHLHDHKFEITAKVGEPINIYEKDLQWSDFGINKQGNTQALLMDSEILKDYNSKIFNEYKSGRITQHSVGMQYMKIDLAVNNDSYEDEYKIWQDNIESLGNKELAESKGYFWLVREAKLVEISAVLMGSNELTPTLENKTEAVIDTSKNEPSADTQILDLLTNIKI